MKKKRYEVSSFCLLAGFCGIWDNKKSEYLKTGSKASKQRMFKLEAEELNEKSMQRLKKAR